MNEEEINRISLRSTESTNPVGSTPRDSRDTALQRSTGSRSDSDVSSPHSSSSKEKPKFGSADISFLMDNPNFGTFYSDSIFLCKDQIQISEQDTDAEEPTSHPLERNFDLKATSLPSLLLFLTEEHTTTPFFIWSFLVAFRF